MLLLGTGRKSMTIDCSQSGQTIVPSREVVALDRYSMTIDCSQGGQTIVPSREAVVLDRYSMTIDCSQGGQTIVPSREVVILDRYRMTITLLDACQCWPVLLVPWCLTIYKILFNVRLYSRIPDERPPSPTTIPLIRPHIV